MMTRALTGLAALLLIASCAGVEPAGRNSRREASTPPPVSQPAPAPRAAPALPPPTQTQSAQTQATPAPLPPPPVETRAVPDVASQARVTPEPRPVRREPSEDDDIVVQGQAERQVPAPNGDPRSTIERVRDVRAWDQCVSRAQAAGEVDPMRPALETPEELCSRSLGMADRMAVPISRREP
jgi:hypothetical protein